MLFSYPGPLLCNRGKNRYRIFFNKSGEFRLKRKSAIEMHVRLN